MYAPQSGRYAVGTFLAGVNGTFPSRYIGAAPMLHADHDGVYDFDVAIGEFASEQEARNWVYTQPRWDGKFEYRFDQNIHSRQNFWISHGTDQLERNINTEWIINPDTNDGSDNGGRDMDVQLPERWVDATSYKHMYWNMSLRGVSNVSIVWRKAGDPQEYYQFFSLNADGNYRVVDFDLSGNPNWNGDVVQVKLKRGTYGSGYPALQNDQWRIKWISYRNLGN